MRSGAVESFVGESGRTISYEYDNLNRILIETAVANDGGYSTSYTYDLAGNRTQRIVAVINDTAGEQTLTTTYTYDPATDRLLSEVHAGPVWAVMFDGKPVYAYAKAGGGVVYKNAEGRIGAVKAFYMGLPTKWSQYALAALILLAPAVFCVPAMVALLALALGAKTYKLKFGHRRANHPVKNLKTGKIEITSQNHGFCVDMETLNSKDVELTHLNLNDNTVEGIRCGKKRAFSVQYHPEASPGPHDSNYLFEDFVKLMSK